MPAKKFRPSSGRHSLIEQVIAAPLEAAARANSNMAHEQLAFVLKYCFEEKAEGKYTPRMINLTITRQELVQDGDGGGELVSFDTTINIPILTIVPLSSLAVEKVEIDFDLEVTSVESRDKQSKQQQSDNTAAKSDSVSLRGKIGPPRTSTSNSSRKDQSKANLEIKLTAGPLPLPTGILSIVDSFAKQIAPHEIKSSDDSSSPSALPDSTET